MNFRSVIAVVKFITVLNGFASRIDVYGSMWKILTLPIFDPVARSFPFGLTASLVVLNPPESDTLPMHFRMFRSH